MALDINQMMNRLPSLAIQIMALKSLKEYRAEQLVLERERIEALKPTRELNALLAELRLKMGTEEFGTQQDIIGATLPLAQAGAKPLPLESAAAGLASKLDRDVGPGMLKQLTWRAIREKPTLYARHAEDIRGRIAGLREKVDLLSRAEPGDARAGRLGMAVMSELGRIGQGIEQASSFENMYRRYYRGAADPNFLDVMFRGKAAVAESRKWASKASEPEDIRMDYNALAVQLAGLTEQFRRTMPELFFVPQTEQQ